MCDDDRLEDKFPLLLAIFAAVSPSFMDPAAQVLMISTVASQKLSLNHYLGDCEPRAKIWPLQRPPPGRQRFLTNTRFVRLPTWRNIMRRPSITPSMFWNTPITTDFIYDTSFHRNLLYESVEERYFLKKSLVTLIYFIFFTL